MKLSEAIEILTDLLGEGPQFPPNDRRDAVKLGIAALKFRQLLEQEDPLFTREPLPGETPEDNHD